MFFFPTNLDLKHQTNRPTFLLLPLLAASFLPHSKLSQRSFYLEGHMKEEVTSDSFPRVLI